MHMPNWWWELVGILGIDNFPVLAQKIRASYEVPQARSKAQKVDNNYSSPTFTKCICQKAFLPPQDLKFPYQDYREGQMQKDPSLHTGPPVLGRED